MGRCNRLENDSADSRTEHGRLVKLIDSSTLVVNPPGPPVTEARISIEVIRETKDTRRMSVGVTKLAPEFTTSFELAAIDPGQPIAKGAIEAVAIGRALLDSLFTVFHGAELSGSLPDMIAAWLIAVSTDNEAAHGYPVDVQHAIDEELARHRADLAAKRPRLTLLKL